MNKYLYLITVENDVEPEIIGPFKDEDERDRFAKEFREKYGFEGGIFLQDIESETPPKSITARAYVGGFFRGDDEFEEVGEEPTARPTPRNLAACYNLKPEQIEKVEKVMMRTGEGVPTYLEMPEGPEDVTACWVYGSDLRQIGLIEPAEAFKL